MMQYCERAIDLSNDSISYIQSGNIVQAFQNLAQASKMMAVNTPPPVQQDDDGEEQRRTASCCIPSSSSVAAAEGLSRSEEEQCCYYSLSWEDIPAPSSPVSSCWHPRTTAAEEGGSFLSAAGSCIEEPIFFLRTIRIISRKVDAPPPPPPSFSSPSPTTSTTTESQSPLSQRQPLLIGEIKGIIWYNLAVTCNALGLNKIAGGTGGNRKQAGDLLLDKAVRLYDAVLECISSSLEISSTTTASKNDPSFSWIIVASLNNQGCISHRFARYDASSTCLDRIKALLLRGPTIHHCSSFFTCRSNRVFCLNLLLLESPIVACAA
jgi:hypothetical protein